MKFNLAHHQFNCSAVSVLMLSPGRKIQIIAASMITPPSVSSQLIRVPKTKNSYKRVITGAKETMIFALEIVRCRKV